MNMSPGSFLEELKASVRPTSNTVPAGTVTILTAGSAGLCAGTGATAGNGGAASVGAGAATDELAPDGSAAGAEQAKRLNANKDNRITNVRFFIVALQIVGTDFSIPKFILIQTEGYLALGSPVGEGA
jgi:hypothetical protein